MKNILIIYPHWPPSNLVGVHRVRLIANYLSDFNYNPIVLTVDPKYYEEKPDVEMIQLVSPEVEVVYSKAYKVTNPRIIGDIGLRAYFQLKRKALSIIRSRNIDFIWISIPSFYTSLLGRSLYKKTKVPFGIDYQDPWVKDISNRKNVRARLSLFAAKVLEPIAVKHAKLITGVSEAYYKDVLNRNFGGRIVNHTAMALGFDPNDHKIRIKNINYPWDRYVKCSPIVYAGAFLPKSDLFCKLLFQSIAELKNEKRIGANTILFFLGTGNYGYKSISDYARENNIQDCIIEIRNRFPFLHILNILSKASGVMLLGSTEKHYTASKTYQVLLSGRPVFPILHSDSTAVKVFEECDADNFLCKYYENEDVDTLKRRIKNKFLDFVINKTDYNPNLEGLDKYSAKKSAHKLVEGIERCLK